MAKERLVIGNWKMLLSHKAAIETARSLHILVKELELKQTKLVVCPSYPSLPAVAAEFKSSQKVGVGAQNVHWEEKGSWTGSVSVSQIKPFASWCLVGHSEQRWQSSLTDEQVAASAKLLIRQGIRPIVCVGESGEERQAEQSISKVTSQIKILLANMSRSDLNKLVIAYEPGWAISANRPKELPTPASVAEMIVLIRKTVAESYDSEAAQRLTIIYGGSVDRRNAGNYLAEPGVEGVLPGASSVQPRQLVEIARLVDEAKGAD